MLDVSLWQREVKELVVRVVGLRAYLDESFTKRQVVVQTRDATFSKELVSQAVENVLVFTQQRRQPTFGIERLTNDYVALTLEVIQLLGGERRATAHEESIYSSPCACKARCSDG